MKKVLLVIALAIAFFTNVSAQKEKGFGAQIELGYGFGAGETYFNVFQISAMPGYHFNPYVFAGIGIGFNSYSAIGGNLSTFPIFAHATVNLLPHKTFTPFVAMKIGYGIGNRSVDATYNDYDIKASIKQGFYIAPSVGVKYRLNKGNAISIGLIYDVMTFRTSLSGIVNSSVSANNNALAIRLGWEF